MNILQKIDGCKTYVLLGVAVIFGVIEFMIKGDYSMSSFIVLSQQAWFVALVAAIRHAIGKAGNQGVVTTATSSNSATVAILMIFLLIGGTAFAQSTPSTNISQAISADEQSVNVPSVIQTLTPKAVNTGFFYNWKDEKVQPTFSYPALGSMNFGTWGTWDYVNIGYATPNVLLAGTGLVIYVSAIEKKWGITAPANIQSFLNNLSIGFTPFVGLEDTGSKNRFTGGPGLSVKASW